MPNAVDPTESYPANRTKAVTEEDVRVSDWVGDLVNKFEKLDEKELNRRRSELELKLVARFENVPDPIIPLGSAGFMNVSTSELRWMAARTLAGILLDVLHTAPTNRENEVQRVEREQREAAEAQKEREKNEDKKDDEFTAVSPEADPTLRTTQPSQNIDFTLRQLGVKDDKTPNTAPGKTDQDASSVSRQENKSVATGRKDEADDGTSARTTAPNNPTRPEAHKREEAKDSDNKK